MELNKIVFPARRCKYTSKSFPGELIWIPARGPHPEIPCVSLQSRSGSSKLLLHFHGNAEDLKESYELMNHLRDELGVHVIGVEYPGYGLYRSKVSEARIIEDADYIFEYIANTLNYGERNIIVFGRSIGSGPATWLAAHKNPAALVLLSAPTSIRSVVKNVAGKLISYLVKERFRNIDLMKKVSCPTFIAHGQKDTLISYKDSVRLHDACEGPCSLILPKKMDHNVFDFSMDLTLPLSCFLMHCGVEIKHEVRNKLPKQLVAKDRLF